MKLGLPSLSLTSLVMLLSCNSAVNANFDLYAGYVTIFGGSNQQPYYAEKWFAFNGEPSCNDAWAAKSYSLSSDVSGDKTGVRCVGYGCFGNTDPASISIVEMHFSNNPLYHWTIYKDRGSYDMIGLDGRVYGNCDPFSGDDFLCTHLVQTISGDRKFRCHSQFTAGQLNSANRMGLTLAEAAERYNITGTYPAERENDLE